MSRAEGSGAGVDRGMRLRGITSAALEMIGVGTVSAVVAVVISWDVSGGWAALVLAVLFALSFVLAPLILDLRAAVREYERAVAGTDREATLDDLRDVSAELTRKVRMLREEVAQLRKPWWRRRRAG